MRGPGGGYRPDPKADFHLLAGDETAVPAIAAALESLPENAMGAVFLEVPDDDDADPWPAESTWGEAAWDADEQADVVAWTRGETGAQPVVTGTNPAPSAPVNTRLGASSGFRASGPTMPVTQTVCRPSALNALLATSAGSAAPGSRRS